MTVTETATPTDTAVDPTHSHETAVGGFAAVLGSGDHKTIGRLYILTALLSLLVTGVTGALLGIERIDLGTADDVLDADVIAQVFSLHSVGGTFLFAFPLLVGLAMLVVPLQVGAATIAFPRAAAASFWTFLISAGLVEAAFLINGGPGGGDQEGVELFLAALFLLVVSLILATVCIVTTVMTLRAPGMSLDRVPLFSWSNLVAGVVWLLTLPVFAGVLVLLFVDNRYFREFTGGNTGIYEHLAWIFGQPAVYLFAIPALGVAADVVPVAARNRLMRHTAALAAIGGFAVLSLGAWAQLGFSLDFTQTAERAYLDEGPWLAFGLLTLAPLLVLVALLAGTIVNGTLRVTSPLIFSAGALVVLVLGAGIGAVIPFEAADLGPTALSAQSHAVFAATALGIFGGVTHWASKITGRQLAELPSRLVATVITVGAIVLVVPDLISGVLDADSDVDTIEVLNLVSLIGGLVVVLGALGFIGLLFAGAASTSDAGDDPWEGHTLEWATPSPPPVGNFAEVPAVTSEAPLLDAREEDA